MTLMHINVTIGLLGFLGGVGAAIQGYVSAHSHGHSPDMIALASKLTMAALTGIYVAMCVRSFIAVRRARQA
jgi:Zn-dependent protease